MTEPLATHDAGRTNGHPKPILTDEQWLLVEPLVSTKPRQGRGRPLVDRRALVDGILLKLLTGLPWYLLPLQNPSWQSCYLAHCRWSRQGVMDEIFRVLLRDLTSRGGFVLDGEFVNNSFKIGRFGGRARILPRADLVMSWQNKTMLVLLQAFLARKKRH